MWVSPFRDLRVNGYLLLTAAYRSLSRLSSALSAKASTLRSSSLDRVVIRSTLFGSCEQQPLPTFRDYSFSAKMGFLRTIRYGQFWLYLIRPSHFYGLIMDRI